MVRERMGLLDEAIREHLELKRRRGADPSVVAREEHEALTPSLPAEPAETELPEAGAPAAEPAETEWPEAELPEAELPEAGAPATVAEPLHEPSRGLDDDAALGEETAELDMQAEIAEQLEMGPLGRDAEDAHEDGMHGASPWPAGEEREPARE